MAKYYRCLYRKKDNTEYKPSEHVYKSLKDAKTVYDGYQVVWPVVGSCDMGFEQIEGTDTAQPT